MKAILRVALVGLVAAAPVALAQQPGQVIAEIDVYSDGDFLLAPVEVFGQKHLFVIDSGSDCTVYDTALPLGPPRHTARANTPDGQMPLALFAAPQATLGGMALKGNNVVAGIDLTQMRETQGHDIRGIIGMDVLRRHVLRIDFDAGKVRFLRSVGHDAGQPAPLHFEGSSPLPHISLTVAGATKPLSFRVDTGMLSGGTIRSDLAVDLVEKERAVPWYMAHATALSGASSRQVWRIDDVHWQHWSHRHLFFREGNSNAVGLDYLSRYNLTFDFPKSTVYCTKSRLFDHATKLNLTGIRLALKQGRPVVNSVAEKSAADEAGIRAGDDITAIGDQPAERLRLKTIDDLLATNTTLTTSRAGKQMQFVLGRQ